MAPPDSEGGPDSSPSFLALTLLLPCEEIDQSPTEQEDETADRKTRWRLVLAGTLALAVCDDDSTCEAETDAYQACLSDIGG